MNEIPVDMDFCLDIDGVVRILKLKNKSPYQTVVRLAQKGLLRGRKCGKAWRFHRKAVEDYLLVGTAR